MAGKPRKRRPALTLTEAAEAAGVSRVTMRRRLDDDAFPNAYRDEGPQGTETGPWLVPVEDLLAAGFKLHQPDTGSDDDQHQARDTPTDTADAGEVSELRAKLERSERELAEWKARAEEREHNLEDLRTAMRMLEAGPPSGRGTEERKRWWRR